MRATRRAKRSGRPMRGRERQHAHRIGAADAGGERGDGGAQHVHPRIAPGHHAPGGLGRDERRLRRKPAGLLDARPQRAKRAELGDGQELVGVGGEPEFDHAARGIERDAGAFERAEISDRDREHIGQLLRLRAAGVVDDAAVGGGERALEAGLGQRGDMLAEARHQIA